MESLPGHPRSKAQSIHSSLPIPLWPLCLLLCHQQTALCSQTPQKPGGGFFPITHAPLRWEVSCFPQYHSRPCPPPSCSLKLMLYHCLPSLATSTFPPLHLKAGNPFVVSLPQDNQESSYFLSIHGSHSRFSVLYPA